MIRRTIAAEGKTIRSEQPMSDGLAIGNQVDAPRGIYPGALEVLTPLVSVVVLFSVSSVSGCRVSVSVVGPTTETETTTTIDDSPSHSLGRERD